MDNLESMKQMLQKVISDMDDMSAQNTLPDGHPKKIVAASMEAAPADASGISADQPDDESSEMDPNVLSQLMDKAGSANDAGEMPEDQNSDLPPEIMAAVARNKKKPV